MTKTPATAVMDGTTLTITYATATGDRSLPMRYPTPERIDQALCVIGADGGDVEACRVVANALMGSMA